MIRKKLTVSFLPPTNEATGTQCFQSCLFVNLSVYGGMWPLSLPAASDIWWWSLETCSNLLIRGSPGSDIWWWPLKLKHLRFQAGGTHPTGMLSCLNCSCWRYPWGFAVPPGRAEMYGAGSELHAVHAGRAVCSLHDCGRVQCILRVWKFVLMSPWKSLMKSTGMRVFPQHGHRRVQSVPQDRTNFTHFPNKITFAFFCFPPV